MAKHLLLLFVFVVVCEGKKVTSHSNLTVNKLYSIHFRRPMQWDGRQFLLLAQSAFVCHRRHRPTYSRRKWVHLLL